MLVRELFSYELARLGRAIHDFPGRHANLPLSVGPLGIGLSVRRRIAATTFGIYAARGIFRVFSTACGGFCRATERNARPEP